MHPVAKIFIHHGGSRDRGGRPPGWARAPATAGCVELSGEPGRPRSDRRGNLRRRAPPWYGSWPVGSDVVSEPGRWCGFRDRGRQSSVPHRAHQQTPAYLEGRCASRRWRRRASQASSPPNVKGAFSLRARSGAPDVHRTAGAGTGRSSTSRRGAAQLGVLASTWTMPVEGPPSRRSPSGLERRGGREGIRVNGVPPRIIYHHIHADGGGAEPRRSARATLSRSVAAGHRVARAIMWRARTSVVQAGHVIRRSRGDDAD